MSSSQIHPKLPLNFDYNVSHDSNWVVLAWLPPNSTATRVGVDVMRVGIPWEGETVDQFVEGLQDQVSSPRSHFRPDRPDPPPRLAAHHR